MTAAVTCSSCQADVVDPRARFCAQCGSPVPQPATSASESAFGPTQRPQYSVAFLNTVRLLSAACMLSAMLAVIRYGSVSSQSRILIVLSVMTALSGQLFVMEATKPAPPPWVQVPLTALGVGIAVVCVAWVVALS